MFSIVIPTCNRAAILRESLKYVLNMKAIETCEIIVVDDGSNDETADVVHLQEARASAPIRYIYQENQGPGVARNAGIEQAKYSRILFIDDDVYPDGEMLVQHRRFLENGYDISQGILLWHPSIEKDRLVQFMEKRGMQFAYDIDGQGDKVSYIHIYTANLAVRKRDIMEAGGFDRDLSVKRYAFEDTAIAYRMSKKGLRMGLNKKAKAWHYHPQTIRSIIDREYKVGFSSGILKTNYPEIFNKLDFNKTVQSSRFQAEVLKVIAAIPWLDKVFGYDMALRIRLREAFIRGYVEYMDNS